MPMKKESTMPATTRPRSHPVYVRTPTPARAAMLTRYGRSSGSAVARQQYLPPPSGFLGLDCCANSALAHCLQSFHTRILFCPSLSQAAGSSPSDHSCPTAHNPYRTCLSPLTGSTDLGGLLAPPARVGGTRWITP